MSAIPAGLARRLDRLARRAHRFHRFAHHPLCQAYVGETLRIGARLCICRGCAAAAGGALAGVIAGVALPLPTKAAGAVLAVATAIALAAPLTVRALRAPRSHRRPSKLVTRTAPLALAAVLVVSGARARNVGGAAVAAAAAGTVVLAVAAYRRRGPDRSPCGMCPERTAPVVCSGYRRIVRREAAFARAAGRLLRALPAPNAPVKRPGWPRTTRS